jgi:cytochrome c oxidase cbb3-type subunit III
MRRIATILTAACGLALLPTGCKREQRSFHVPPSAAAAPSNVPAINPFVRPGPAGAPLPNSPTTGPSPLPVLATEPYADLYPKNAQALSDGNTLYEFYNCVGCHAHGGGGMGPPLLDPKWFYGGQPQQLYASIVEGRPNGMPSYRGRIPDYQVWEIVAYVRSLSGNASPQAAPGREEHMHGAPPPNSTPKQPPQTVAPPATGPIGGHVPGKPPSATAPAK